MIPTVSFIGRSGSGKTTFLEKLIPLMTQRGHRIGVVKNAHHGGEIDIPGKDSYRLRKAGASQVILNTPAQMALIRSQEGKRPLLELLAYFKEVDLIIIEGYKGEEVPRIEVFRTGAGDEKPLLAHGVPVIGLITDMPTAGAAVPVFSLDDADGVARFIELKILNK